MQKILSNENTTDDIPSKRWHLMDVILKMISKLQFTSVYIQLVPCSDLLLVFIVILVIVIATLLLLLLLLFHMMNNTLYNQLSGNHCYNGDRNDIIHNGNSKNVIIAIIFLNVIFFLIIVFITVTYSSRCYVLLDFCYLTSFLLYILIKLGSTLL